MAHAPLRPSSSLLSSAMFLLLCLQTGRSPRCHVQGVARSKFRGLRRSGRVQVFALLAGTGAFKTGAQRGFAWCLPQNRDLQSKGPGNVGTSFLPRTIRMFGGYGRQGSDRRYPSSCNGCPACSVCAAAAYGGRGEMLSVNCDSRTGGNGQRNCQAANAASRKRTTDRQQARR